MEEENKKITFHKVLWYIIIFSLLGLLLESIYGFVVMKILNKGVGFTLGPLSVIYGISSVAIIFALKGLKKHGIKLFVIGGVLATFIQYIISFGLESVLGVRFWDLNYIYNLNGRICLVQGIIVAVLSVVTIKFVLGIVDKIIDKMNSKSKIVKTIDIIITVLISILTLFTLWGVIVYKDRANDIYNEVKVFDEKNFIQKAGDSIFTNDLMGTVYPKLRFLTKDGKVIIIKDMINVEEEQQ